MRENAAHRITLFLGPLCLFLLLNQVCHHSVPLPSGMPSTTPEPQAAGETARSHTESPDDSSPALAATHEEPAVQPKPDIPFLRGVNLGNALEAPPSEDWGVTIQEAYFQAIREAGFNAVRIPVRFSGYTGSAPGYRIHEDFLAGVDEAVQWGLENDLIVILDLHHFDAFKQDPQGEREKFLAIWKQVSEHYRDIPPELYFELLSEPSTNVTPALWNDVLRDAITIIRETNPIRKVVVDGIDYADVDALSLLELPDDDNLVATFHYYEPFEFTHQGAAWVSGSASWIGTTWSVTLEERKAITEALDRAAEWSLLHEIPVIIGEFGVSSTADAGSRQAWFQFVAQQAEKRDIGWIVWQFCSDFGIYDCALRTWDEAILDALLED